MNSLMLARNIDLSLRRTLDQVEAHLQAQLSGRVRNLNLLLQGDGLVLRGSAHTYYAKQLAQHAVMGEVNLPIVANEIEVT